MTESSRFDFGGAYRWYVMCILFLVSALAYVDRQAMSVLVVPLQHSLHISDVQVGLLLGPAFMLLYAGGGMPMGFLADRCSRRYLLVAGVVLWSVATVACGFVRSFDGLLIARAAVGLGEACIVPAAFSLVADYFAPEMRGRANAIVTLGFPVGTSLALFGGGFILRSVHVFTGYTSALLGSRMPWELVLIIFGTAGLGVAMLMLTVREPPRMHTSAAPEHPAAVNDKDSFTRFLWRERLSLLLVLTPYVLLAYMQYALTGWIPTLIERRYGLPSSSAGILYGAITLLTVPFSILMGGAAADRRARGRRDGRFTLVKLVAPLFFPGVALLSFGHSIVIAGMGLVLISVVGGILSTTVYSVVQEVAPAALRGRTLAFYSLLANLVGLGLGPLVTALITDHVFGNKDQLYLSVLIATGPAWLIVLLCGYLGPRHYEGLRDRA